MKRGELAAIVAGVALALGGLAYLYHEAAATAEPMKPDKFARVVRQLASDARESQRLAVLVGTAQVNANYARAHHEKVADDVHDALRELDAPPPKDGEAQARRATELGARLHDLLEHSAPHLADRAAMQRLGEEHARIAHELEGLAPR